MRKVFLDDLPRWKNGPYCGSVKWKNCINRTVDFVYDQIKGQIEILDVNGSILKLTYNSKVKNMCNMDFKNAKIGELIGTRDRNYKYKCGEIVDNLKSGVLKILSMTRIGDRKGYVYECLRCGNIGKITEGRLNAKSGCSVCSNRKTVRGINDINTLDARFGALLWNQEDGYNYSTKSNQKVDFKCPNCLIRIENKAIHSVYTNGLSCPRCSDGVSYPEKFMYSLLENLNLKYDYQKIFLWNKNKRYDFYVPEFKLIIETHGIQHFEEGFRYKDSRSLAEEIKNDKEKRDIALKNGIIHYIVINCSRSEMKFIVENILNSELPNILSLKEINWDSCHEQSCSSLVKKVCDLWENDKMEIKDISLKMNLWRGTIRDYLKKGHAIGWCEYNPINERIKTSRIVGQKRNKPIVRLSINGDYIDEFRSAVVANQVVGVSNEAICNNCRGRTKTAGGYKWMYKEDYEKYIRNTHK